MGPCVHSLATELRSLDARLRAACSARDGWSLDMDGPLQDLCCELDALTAPASTPESPVHEEALHRSLDLLVQSYRHLEHELFLPALACAVGAALELRRLRLSLRRRR